MGMRGIGGGFGSISSQQNVEATMVVSLYDVKQKELIWRGIAQDTLNNNGNKNQKEVQKAVEKMLKQWPIELMDKMTKGSTIQETLHLEGRPLSWTRQPYAWNISPRIPSNDGEEFGNTLIPNRRSASAATLKRFEHEERQ
jgi:hypothetical protein